GGVVHLVEGVDPVTGGRFVESDDEGIEPVRETCGFRRADAIDLVHWTGSRGSEKIARVDTAGGEETSETLQRGALHLTHALAGDAQALADGLEGHGRLPVSPKRSPTTVRSWSGRSCSSPARSSRARSMAARLPGIGSVSLTMSWSVEAPSGLTGASSETGRSLTRSSCSISSTAWPIALAISSVVGARPSS